MHKSCYMSLSWLKCDNTLRVVSIYANNRLTQPNEHGATVGNFKWNISAGWERITPNNLAANFKVWLWVCKTGLQFWSWTNWNLKTWSREAADSNVQEIIWRQGLETKAGAYPQKHLDVDEEIVKIEGTKPLKEFWLHPCPSLSN